MYPQRAVRRCRLRDTPVLSTQSSAPLGTGPAARNEATTAHKRASSPPPQPSLQLAIESFRDHIDALYLLALLYTGERRRAEEAVVDAMVAAAADPSITAGDPPWVWRGLAAHLCRSSEQTIIQGSSAASVQMAGLSPLQCETMALLVAGRDVHEVATLLDLPEKRVPVEFRSATGALDAALRSSPPSD
jgi:hypothetical protein